MPRIIENSFAEIRKNLKRNYSKFDQVKISLLSDFSARFLEDILKGLSYDFKLNMSVFTTEVNSVSAEVINKNSNFRKFDAEYIFLSFSTLEFERGFYKNKGTKKFVKDYKENIFSLLNTQKKESNKKIFLTNLIESVNRIDSSLTNNDYNLKTALKDINFEIEKFISNNSGVFLIDINNLALDMGLKNAIDFRSYYLTQNPYSNDFLIELSKNILNLIDILRGNAIKLIVLDLDNTLYGGIVGDVGSLNIEVGSLGIGKAFTDFQMYLKQLKNTGIALCVVSKNDLKTAEDAFKNNPEMVLSLDDFVVFKANWKPKSENIKEIKEMLNIGYSSILFIDDNPFERNEIKETLKDVNVLNLPIEKTNYLSYLKSQNIFLIAENTPENKLRLKQYKNEEKRNDIKNKSSSFTEYLKKLNMVGNINLLDKKTIPRVSQLSLRSNQFNLRTVRYLVEDLNKIFNNKNYIVFSVSLKDKFDDLGIIAFATLKVKKGSLFIENFVLSCRAAKRGVEEFIVNEILRLAKKKKIEKIEAEYIASPKNSPSKELYENLGFKIISSTKTKKCYELNIKGNKNNILNTYIKESSYE